MNTKKTLALALILGLVFGSCGGPKQGSEEDKTSGTPEAGSATEQSTADATKGVGKFQHVELTHPLDQNMIKLGQSTYDVKCSSCHRLSGEKLVGPGWKGVTDRRTPEWVMNFITNVDEMLTKDTAAQAMLEVCMVRMPNQNLKDDEARAVLEFMRQNDGKN